MRDVLLGTHPQLRRPLALTALTCVLMGCCILAMQAVAAAGLADARPVHWWSLASGCWVLGCFVLIRSGLTQHWRDPAFTLVQIGGAIASNALAYVIAGQGRGIVPPMLALVMIFCVFGLTPRQIKGLLAYAVALYVLAIAATQRQPRHAPDTMLTLVYLFIIVMVLMASTRLTLYIHGMRQRLQRQKGELADALAQIRALATRDELTGLPNRRYAQEALRLKLLRAQRGGQPVQLAVLDLDFFKHINDLHGHVAGDQVLRHFAATVQAGIRAEDILARWGGEEFILLLDNTTAPEAAALLERVRQAVQAMSVTLGDGALLRTTVSLGAAEQQAGDTPQTLFERADGALYAAKTAGRNRLAWAADTAPQPSKPAYGLSAASPPVDVAPAPIAARAPR
ncbi:hypothetical protein GCM10022279_04660 [Comamonas faecalis]|uniref:diguanylate cyclase n=1 Tax=Comamonas faecalis TaxID=1387849 RepID=A0ABP7QM64_9BURK